MGTEGCRKEPQNRERPLFTGFFSPVTLPLLGKEAGNGCFICGMEAGPKVPNGENRAAATGLGQDKGQDPGWVQAPWEAVGCLWPCALGRSGITPHCH